MEKKFDIDISKLIDHSSVGGINEEIVERDKRMSLKEIHKNTDFINTRRGSRDRWMESIIGELHEQHRHKVCPTVKSLFMLVRFMFVNQYSERTTA